MIGALAYPTILFVLGTIVVNVLIIFFVPKFETALRYGYANGANCRPSPIGCCGSATRCRSYGIFIAAAVIVLLGLFIRSRLRNRRRPGLARPLRLKVPVVSGIYLSLAVSRFCRVLGTLLTGGVPIVRSLEISADSTGNRVLSAAVRDAAENISAGQSLAPPLAASGQFPGRRRRNDRRRRAIEQLGNRAAPHCRIRSNAIPGGGSIYSFGCWSR